MLSARKQHEENSRTERTRTIPAGDEEGDFPDVADAGGSGVMALLWHGGSVYDAWFSCASNQVRSIAQVYHTCNALV
ncbi:hypothetical protein ZOSMA_7G00930 [Zostera marina]|uniref:Uncharacterized protein n=1 Tax=Zostera marina TaxID=29655 RepID=A0A0K9NMQ9_ZOSMR|nr:hypothetical protein ZOSMA_7G00930 [Zostera marina]